ncbi:MAG: GNAT family N-acetyltransferase [Pseudonocardia sp. SCN 72-86]|nr:MAG: GNAT family N-acetyltransferase [Pseudonocardia sp. SCN 72-86]
MSASTSSGSVRPIESDDVATVVELVHELADYEREPESCHLTSGQLEAALFGAAPALFGHVAVVDGQVVGCALWFLNFSTWEGVHGIHLEDLYVRPAFRGGGLGFRLLATLAAECTARGFARLEWSVLDWNTPSIEFYRALGAVGMDEWTNFRLDGEALSALSGRADRAPTSGNAR